MSEPSFEQQLDQLESLVTRLESGDVPLAEAMAAFEQGMALSKQCSTLLNQAEQRISQLMNEGDDAPSE
ncbi:exodeoxyribonuclease VII small subunit [Litorivicinus lipolyticus]|uniref:Exodeoxyribonuclease 7 small subunit n=1 Tax=Litorivicinus lipolyticus TaxID=418701 RepID=A0A5Q2QAW3_9GAMM|nr:exodeoxyribonuclease VII small subunit [Litorivicinus lipolyticus]QGG79431.1 exodeoxyribonuclease VII small subunit [Litorivicinus lipolyticus]